MSDLKYRTLTNDSPERKQKVYVCFHPDDFDNHFENVCKDIFEVAPGCAVYYVENSNEEFNSDDLILALSNMQAVVVIVTKKFLLEHSRAKNTDLPFALGQISYGLDSTVCHIPVLPIVVEPSIFDLLNSDSLLGGMQCLSRFVSSDNGLSYEEKLKRFLDAVLISDDEKDLIQKEFAARIFLSYRKKDRALARKLMELIHNVDFCRDVAIWYDEYLALGESWHDNIFSELDANDMFLLNVTLNILEEGNFVSEQEYPAAKQSGKPILPVETESIDRNKLEEMYEGTLASLVEADNGLAFRSALQQKLVNEAGKKNLLEENNSAEHLYYIGLAYKNNVGVEPNATRAVQLLKMAAEKGYRDAYYTLGQMYDNGDSVPRDENQAVKNFFKYIEEQKPYFGQSKIGDYKLLLAYDAIGMKYLAASKLNQAFDLYEELNSLLEGMTSCYGSFLAINQPNSYERLGNIRMKQGKVSEAKDFFDKAQDARIHPRQITNIATEEDRDETNPKEYNELHAKCGTAVNLYNQGNIAELSGNIDEAKNYYLRSKSLFEEIFPKMVDSDIQVNLSKTCYKLGVISLREGDFDATYDNCIQAYGYAKNAIKYEKNPEAHTSFVSALFGLGAYYRACGEYEDFCQARECYTDAVQAIDKAEKLFGSNITEGLRANVYDYLGIVYEKLNDSITAEKYFKDFLTLQKKIAQNHEEEIDAQRSLSVAYEHLGQLYFHRGDYGSAIQCFLEDEPICERLAENIDDIQAQQDLAICYWHMATTYHKMGSYEDALKFYVREVVIENTLVKIHPGISEIDSYATTYFNIGTLCSDVSSACLDTAIKNWRILFEETHLPGFNQEINNAESIRRDRFYQFPISRGFTSDMRELIGRYASDLEAPGKFAYNPFANKSSLGLKGLFGHK